MFTACSRGAEEVGTWRPKPVAASGDLVVTSAMHDPAIHTVRMSSELRDQIVIHLVREAPNEGVGLLAVTRNGGNAEATAFFPGENIDASPTRFTMHPRDVVTALDRIASQGWELGAIVHSHLKGPATPSRTDMDEAHYPDALMVIVSLALLPPDLKVWRLEVVDDGLVARRVPVELVGAKAAGDIARE